ncbi:MAG: CBS domain-containing protein [Granulosicoccus sp.]
MLINEVMTTRIVTIDMDDSLRVAKEIFDNVRFHHLLVVHLDKLEGVLSDRDLLKAMSPYLGSAAETNRDRLTLDRKIHQVMTREPVTLQAAAALDEAVEIFINRRFSCIPIVDERKIPVGIVSWRDVLRGLQGNIAA